MANTNEVKEIDLLELFRLIGKGIGNMFKAFFRALLFLIVFGIKKAHWIAIFVVAGGALGYVLYLNTDRFYSSALIAQPNGISAVDIIDYINDLNKYTQNGNSYALSQALDLTEEASKKIKQIKAYHYIDLNNDGRGDIIDFKNTFNPKDTTQKIIGNRFYLQVSVKDNTIFPVLRDGIFKYIEKNPYLTKLNEIRKNELNELILQTEKEISKLDSLQNVDYFKNDLDRLKSRGDYGLMFLSEKEKPMYYRDKLNLILEKQKYYKESELSATPITVLKDFTQLTKEDNPIIIYIIKYCIIFGFIGFTILIAFFYREKIKESLIR